ncbi:TonB-dependent receptor [Croceicoccus mobilis]|uniref:TonB-dependent receptor n=1 Tax=Croceicoccus mobilis TaxID=1703339 RepID=A0A916Z8F6_9SPHN|nr:TonB-dependent receptor [Croceicoccus mobilis]GGD81410.1 TonB-dependent receptor [Croceicoccus mobilis]
MSKDLYGLLAGVALGVFGASGVAVAQAADAPEKEAASAAEGDPIVVTAQKRSQSVDDVGMSIQAFTGDSLRDSGVASASDLTQVVAGFNFSRSNANTPIYTLRGVGFQTPNLSSTSPVGIYVDEVAYAFPYMGNGPLFDIERVEVLKGPQGTLYGRNTTGGLVNFITAKPGNFLEAKLRAEAGNYETYNIEGFVNLPLSDTLAVRLAGRAENRDKGWQRSRTRDERLGKVDRTGLRGSLAWEPTSALTVALSLSWWDDNSDTVAPQATSLDLARPAFAIPGIEDAVFDDGNSRLADWDAAEDGKPAFRTDSRFVSAKLRVDYEFSPDLTLTSLTGYHDLKRRDFTDLDGTPFEILAYQSDGDIESWSEELRLSGDFDSVTWMLGGFYARDRLTDNQFGYYDENSTVRLLRFFGGTIPQTTYTPEEVAGGFRNFRNITNQSNKSWSLLANAEWAVTDRLSLVGGARYTEDTIRFSGCSQDADGNTVPIWNTAVAALTGSNTNVQPNECLTYSADFSDNVLARKKLAQNNVSWRAGVNFEPDPDALLYATVSRGYKSGAFPVLPANVETQFEPAVQERLTAYEIGAKLSPVDFLRFNASGFFYQYKDKQLFGDVEDPVFTTLSRIVNVPKSEVYGAELEAFVQATNELRLQTSATYVHSEITEFVGINRLGNLEDFAGNEFPNTPNWQVNGQLAYDGRISPAVGLKAVLSASYQGAAEGAVGAGQEFRIDPYTLVNGTVSTTLMEDRLELGLFGRNVLNEKYYTTVDTVIDTIFSVPGMPRTYGLYIEYRFD